VKTRIASRKAGFRTTYRVSSRAPPPASNRSDRARMRANKNGGELTLTAAFILR